MNENSSKQVLLSVLGIAVLVVAVVGVSFAFFTYSRQGTQENTITTGEIFFDFTESAVSKIENAFPGTAQDTMTFKVIGRNESTAAIAYTVYGEVMEAGAGQVAFQNGEVQMLITENSQNAETPFATLTTAPMSGTDNVLATGTIPAGTASNLVEEFTIRLQVNPNVTISDTDSSADYCSSRADSEEPYAGTVTEEVECASGNTEFDKLFYGIKIRVEAQAPGA